MAPGSAALPARGGFVLLAAPLMRRYWYRVMDLGLLCRVALVAGASSGLGFAAAHALAAEGCAVSVCGRHPAGLEQAAPTLRQAGDATGAGSGG